MTAAKFEIDSLWSADTDQLVKIFVEIGRALRAANYHFTTPTPLTHRRVLARDATAKTLTDVFGWSKVFTPNVIGEKLFHLLQDAEAVIAVGDRWRSAVRFSSIGNHLFVHSAYPTDAAGSVFFGPDTYRFIGALRKVALEWPDFRPESILDVGAGSGAGGLAAARIFPSAHDVVLTDVNENALVFSRANAVLEALPTKIFRSDVCADISQEVDFVISNPPYLLDARERTYRHGGGSWGEALAIRILEEGLRQLTLNGKLLLYTGSPIVDGADIFLSRAKPILDERGLRYRYEEIDPDVFGEELERPPYDRADRIATVSLFVEKES